jgi:hypothetical protein
MDVERRDDRTFTPYTPPSFHETRSLAATSTILNGWINATSPSPSLPHAKDEEVPTLTQ